MEAICQVFMKHAHKMELESLMKMVSYYASKRVIFSSKFCSVVLPRKKGLYLIGSGYEIRLCANVLVLIFLIDIADI